MEKNIKIKVKSLKGITYKKEIELPYYTVKQEGCMYKYKKTSCIFLSLKDGLWELSTKKWKWNDTPYYHELGFEEVLGKKQTKKAWLEHVAKFKKHGLEKSVCYKRQENSWWDSSWWYSYYKVLPNTGSIIKLQLGEYREDKLALDFSISRFTACTNTEFNKVFMLIWDSLVYSTSTSTKVRKD